MEIKVKIDSKECDCPYDLDATFTVNEDTGDKFIETFAVAMRAEKFSETVIEKSMANYLGINYKKIEEIRDKYPQEGD